jgi:hypothetical protein
VAERRQRGRWQREREVAERRQRGRWQREREVAERRQRGRWQREREAAEREVAERKGGCREELRSRDCRRARQRGGGTTGEQGKEGEGGRRWKQEGE